MYCFILITALFMMNSCNSSNKSEEISVLYMAQAGYQPEEIRKIADDFEKESGIQVKIEFVKYDEQHKKIVKSANLEVPNYDIFSLDLIWTAEFAENKYCVDLTDKVKDFSKEIAPAIIDAFRYKDKIWAMPFLANFQLLFFNKKYIQKAGFTEAPKTLEEMVDQMRIMKSKGIVEYPFIDSWNPKEGLVCEFVWLTAAFGGETFNDSGEPIFNKGPGLKALQFMVMLLDEGLANPLSLNCDEAMAKDIFISGQASFTSNWTFQYALMNNPSISKVYGEADTGLLPVSKSIIQKYKHDTASVSGFQGLGIMNNSPHKEAAWKYINFITSPEIQKAHLEEMPIWNSVQMDETVKKNDPIMDIKAKQIASVHHRPKVVNYTKISSIMQQYIHAALSKKINPSDALTKAADEIKTIK